MVLYGFKKKFATLVESGCKLHTIRDLRKDDRHAKPGDKLQLYTGLRTKQCRKLIEADPICWDVFDIVIDSKQEAVRINGGLLRPAELEALAIGDGCESVKEFFEFFPTAEERKLICWAEIEWLKYYQGLAALKYCKEFRRVAQRTITQAIEGE